MDFSPKQYFAVFLLKVSAWLFNHAVCKIGLRRVLGMVDVGGGREVGVGWWGGGGGMRWLMFLVYCSRQSTHHTFSNGDPWTHSHSVDRQTAAFPILYSNQSSPFINGRRKKGRQHEETESYVIVGSIYFKPKSRVRRSKVFSPNASGDEWNSLLSATLRWKHSPLKLGVKKEQNYCTKVTYTGLH